MQMEMHKRSLRRRVRDGVLRAALILCAALTCALLAGLIGTIFWRGLGGVTWKLLTTAPSFLKDTIGILPNLVNTLYLIVFTLLLALPLSVGAALYLTEYAKNKRLVAAIEFAAETLTGIPSILYGLVGMLFFVQFCGLGVSLLAGIFTLVILILPTILRTTQESLKTVPASYREGALALGSGKWHMIRTIVLPCSADGIVTGCILAVGRIAGESAALLFTAGSASVLSGFWKSLTSSGGSLTVSLYMYTMERGKMDVGFAIAAVLLILTLLLNGTAKLVNRKLKKKY